MKRTQIQLTEEQYKLLKNISNKRNESIAEIIRESITYFTTYKCLIGDKEKVERAADAIGKFKSGLKNISKKHDRYLKEDFAK